MPLTLLRPPLPSGTSPYGRKRPSRREGSTHTHNTRKTCVAGRSDNQMRATYPREGERGGVRFAHSPRVPQAASTTCTASTSGSSPGQSSSRRPQPSRALGRRQEAASASPRWALACTCSGAPTTTVAALPRLQ